MRKSTYILNINNPCSENWDSMTRNECGKYCSHCSKTVIDFSLLTDDEIIKIINETRGKICGHLTTSQLNRAITTQNSNTNRPFSKLLTALLLVIGFTKSSMIYGREPKMEYKQSPFPKHSEIKVTYTDTSSKLLQGYVIDSTTKEAVAGAIIMIKKTSKGVATDNNGYFSLKVPSNSKSENLALVVSYIGYTTREFFISGDSLNQQINIAIIKSEQTLDGELIIVKKKKWWQFWK